MSEYVTVDDIAAKIEAAKPMTGGYVGRCPAHDDQRASFKVTAGEKATLLHCYAGCHLEDILLALGLRKQQLFYDYTETQYDEQDDANRELRRLIAELQPIWVKECRVEDILWQAIVTPKARVVVREDAPWVLAFAQAWLEVRVQDVGYEGSFLAFDVKEALRWPLVLWYQAIWYVMQPMWEKTPESRRDWIVWRDQAMRAVRKTYREQVFPYQREQV